MTDPDAVRAQLKDDPRVRVAEELPATPYGSRKFTIADPDGKSWVSSATSDTRAGARRLLAVTYVAAPAATTVLPDEPTKG